MIDIINKLTKYFEETLSIGVHATRWNKGAGLPLYLQENYDIFTTFIYNRYLLLAVQKNKAVTPAATKKNLDSIGNLAGIDVVLVLETITPYNRTRLIERNIPFIIPGNQMFLPPLGIDLREYYKAPGNDAMSLGASAQAMVMHKLNNWSGNALSLVEYSRLLDISAMTATRACAELEGLNIAKVVVSGRKKKLDFGLDKKSLWEQAYVHLKNPVVKKIFINDIPSEIKSNLRIAGLTALASYTMISEPVNRIYAIDKQEWKSLRLSGLIEIAPYPDTNSVILEVWSYNPKTITGNDNNPTVDRFSLYMSLVNEHDDRIRTALTELKETLAW
jgi:hypothetical protein